MSSPNDNSMHSQTKLISDPNLRMLKMKQGDLLSRKNDDMARSLEQTEFSKSYRDKLDDHVKSNLEISDAKRNIINEIDSGLLKNPKEDLIDVIKNNQIFTDDPYFASPPHPSINSSNLYQISPTSIKKQSKLNSSNKPRSTLKSDSGIDDKSKPDDLIWIKDQSRPKNLGVDVSESVQQLEGEKKISSNSIKRPQFVGKDDLTKVPGYTRITPDRQQNNYPPVISKSNEQIKFNSNSDQNLQGFQSPAESSRKLIVEDDIKRDRDQDKGKLELLGSSSSQGRITQKSQQTPQPRLDFEATHPPSSSIGGLDSLKKELDKMPRVTDSSRPEHSSQKDLLTREGSKRGHGKHHNGEHEDYLNDLTQGIGFDSQIIKNEFEDTKKSTYNLDDFASMSDSERELHRQQDRLKKLNIVSDEILDMIFTDTISDIIQMLENENMDFEREIASGYNGQIYLQDGQDQIAPQQVMLQRRGIRVNFNAVKEYMSLLINFIKGRF
jgi:uncharacterized protein YeeX (DUF496 family)